MQNLVPEDSISHSEDLLTFFKNSISQKKPGFSIFLVEKYFPMAYIEPKITVHVRFFDAIEDQPLTGEDYKVFLYDKDIFEDDYLGSSGLNDKGEATIIFHTGQFKSIDSPLEHFPDLYCVLFRDNTILFQSNIVKDLDIEKYSSFDTQHGWHFNLGTFLIKETTKS